LRILYLANEEIPGRMGGSVHAWEVARGLAARGHEVTALVNRAPGQEREERIEGVRIVRRRLRVGGRMIPLRGLAAAMGLARHADVVLERHITPGGAGAVIARIGILVLEVNSLTSRLLAMLVRSGPWRACASCTGSSGPTACRGAPGKIVPCARDRARCAAGGRARLA
jgi:hypothetical protein